MRTRVANAWKSGLDYSTGSAIVAIDLKVSLKPFKLSICDHWRVVESMLQRVVFCIFVIMREPLKETQIYLFSLTINDRFQYS